MMESINTYDEFKKMEGCIIGASSYLLITDEMNNFIVHNKTGLMILCEYTHVYL